MPAPEVTPVYAVVHENRSTTKDLVHRSPEADGHGWKCRACGGVFPVLRPGDHVGTGYACDEAGALVCYPCCGRRDAEEMAHPTVSRFALYFVRRNPDGGEPHELTNWPGTFRLPCTAIRSGKYTHVRCTHGGRAWVGRLNEDHGQIVTLKVSTGKAPRKVKRPT